MTSSAPLRTRLGIGEVLAELRAEFPDVTISKIRFLEAEGLVEPERTSAGYRKFSRGDVERLRYVLTAQRDRYLPLKVIKDDLDAMDRGLEPSGGAGAPRVPTAVLAGDGLPTGAGWLTDGPTLRLSREELIGAARISADLLDKIEGFKLVRARPNGEHYDADALVVASMVGELAAFGLEPRHLRVFKTAAEREAGLVEQVVTPLRRQRDAEAMARADEVVAQLAAAAVRLHAALVRIGLRSPR